GEVAARLHQAAPLHRLCGVSHRAGRRAAAVAAGGRLSRHAATPRGHLGAWRMRDRAAESAHHRCPDRDVEMPRRASSQPRTRLPRPPRPSVTSATYQGVPMSVANTINWFELYVQDMPRARAVYGAVPGIAVEPLKRPEGGDEGLEMWSFPGDMERYGANGALCRMPGVPSGPGGTLVYFACEDCGITAGRVAAAGGRVHREKMSIGEYGFIA